MSIYNNADTERVYRIAREYVEETQRYVRMMAEADPGNGQVEEVLQDLDHVAEKIIFQKQVWLDSIKQRNPDWEPLK